MNYTFNLSGKYTRFALISSVFLLLAACDNNNLGSQSNGDSSKSISLAFAVPQSLTGPLIAQLQAKVSLDGGAVTALTVNVDNTISGTISKVPAGSHTLGFTYYVTIGGSEVVLATVSKSISVSTGQTTTVTIADNDLNRNIDSDGDGYTNLAEVRMGFDATLRTDKPLTESPVFAVANGGYDEVSSANYDFNTKVGEQFGGNTGSTNFNVTSGFGGY